MHDTDPDFTVFLDIVDGEGVVFSVLSLSPAIDDRVEAVIHGADVYTVHGIVPLSGYQVTVTSTTVNKTIIM